MMIENNLNTLVDESIKKLRMYGINSLGCLKEYYEIPSYIKHRHIRDRKIGVYSYRYIEKVSKNRELNREIRISKYIKPEQDNKNYFDRDTIEELDKYRAIIDYKSQKNLWIKKFQKRIHKDISRALKEIPYLHSGVKKKSFATNAKTHINNDYILTMDIRHFFDSVTEEVVYKTFKKLFYLHKNTAKFYSYLLTANHPYEDKRVLGQGFPSSPVISYICYYDLFNHLYAEAEKNDIKMTLYVDDLTFSSNKPIPQVFIDRLFGLFAGNDLSIHPDKVNLFQREKAKRITGVIINKGEVRVTNGKYEEIEIQYQHLKDCFTSGLSVQDYINMFTVFRKFRGNVEHLKHVQYDGKDESIKTTRHVKYIDLIKDLTPLFPEAIDQKTYADKPIESFSNDNKKKIMSSYAMFLSYIQTHKV